MENLHWQLSVLGKAIHYKNLSGAASHVGLSQPQLSRIVSRLEDELGVVLLDRTARRKSGWTPVAFKIAETYQRSSRKLTQSLQQLKTEDHLTQITIGILEGLIPIATDFCRQLLKQPRLQLVELNVYDLSELEERFEKGELDLVLTCREPGKHKYRYVKNLGFQMLERVGPSTGTKVFSPFEYANHMHSKRTPPKDTRVLLSNSLVVRKMWIEEQGATGFMPSDVTRKRSNDIEVPVIMMAGDTMSPSVWQVLEQAVRV